MLTNIYSVNFKRDTVTFRAAESIRNAYNQFVQLKRFRDARKVLVIRRASERNFIRGYEDRYRPLACGPSSKLA